MWRSVYTDCINTLTPSSAQHPFLRYLPTSELPNAKQPLPLLLLHSVSRFVLDPSDFHFSNGTSACTVTGSLPVQISSGTFGFGSSVCAGSGKELLNKCIAQELNCRRCPALSWL